MCLGRKFVNCLVFTTEWEMLLGGWFGGAWGWLSTSAARGCGERLPDVPWGGHGQDPPPAQLTQSLAWPWFPALGLPWPWHVGQQHVSASAHPCPREVLDARVVPALFPGNRCMKEHDTSHAIISQLSCDWSHFNVLLGCQGADLIFCCCLGGLFVWLFVCLIFNRLFPEAQWGLMLSLQGILLFLPRLY